MLITINGHELTLNAAKTRYPALSRTALKRAAEAGPIWSLPDLIALTAACDAEAKRIQSSQSGVWKRRMRATIK